MADPATAGSAAFSKLAQVGSFAFALSYHTDSPFALGARLQGFRTQLGDECWRGLLDHGGRTSKVDLRASGDQQYERRGPDWQRSPRGLETKVLEQLGTVLKGVRFVLDRVERGRYVYSFSPEIPVIDPARSKLITGVLFVDAGCGLPLEVRCSDTSGTAEWLLTTSGYGRRYSVAMPFAPAARVKARPEIRLSRRSLGRAAEIVAARLSNAGIGNRVLKGQTDLTIELDRSLARVGLELLLAKGDVRLWRACAHSGADTAGHGTTVPVGDDVAGQVVLVKELDISDVSAARPVLESPFEPELAVEFVNSAATDTAADTDHDLAALVIDGRVLGTAALPGAGAPLLFRGIGDAQRIAVLASLFASPQLPVGFSVIP